jgi:hypothetical protein
LIELPNPCRLPQFPRPAIPFQHHPFSPKQAFPNFTSKALENPCFSGVLMLPSRFQIIVIWGRFWYNFAFETGVIFEGIDASNKAQRRSRKMREAAVNVHGQS